MTEKNIKRVANTIVVKLEGGKYWIGETRNPEFYQASIEGSTCNIDFINQHIYVAIEGVLTRPVKEVIAEYIQEHSAENVGYKGSKVVNAKKEKVCDISTGVCDISADEEEGVVENEKECSNSEEEERS